MENLQHIAALPWGCELWNPCCTQPHCLGAVGRGSFGAHCNTALGERAVAVMQYTAALPMGSGQWNSGPTPPHCLGEMGSGNPAAHRRPSLGAMGNGTPAAHSSIAWGQWALGSAAVWSRSSVAPCPKAVQRCVAAVRAPVAPRWCGGVLQEFHCPLPPGGEAVCGRSSSGNPATPCRYALGQSLVELLLSTAALPGGSGQLDSCGTLPHCSGAAGRETPAVVELGPQCSSCPHQFAALVSMTDGHFN